MLDEVGTLAMDARLLLLLATDAVGTCNGGLSNKSLYEVFVQSIQ